MSRPLDSPKDHVSCKPVTRIVGAIEVFAAIKQSGEHPLPAYRKLQDNLTVELEGQSAQELYAFYPMSLRLPGIESQEFHFPPKIPGSTSVPCI
jgi:hypothetical protein